MPGYIILLMSQWETDEAKPLSTKMGWNTLASLKWYKVIPMDAAVGEQVMRRNGVFGSWPVRG